MDNTKFTKGKWKLAENEYGYYTSIRNLDESIKVCTSRVNNQNESNANLLLISKAPEMLEMLEKCKEYFLLKTDRFSEERAEAIGQLIKEATEL